MIIDKFVSVTINSSNIKHYINLNYRKVRIITRKNKKELQDKWDGRDYYDNEYIKDNFQLDPNDKNYPTIDHKISIYNGFKNSIDCEIIGGLDNLCITKRTINSTKNKNNTYEPHKNI